MGDREEYDYPPAEDGSPPPRREREAEDDRRPERRSSKEDRYRSERSERRYKEERNGHERERERDRDYDRERERDRGGRDYSERDIDRERRYRDDRYRESGRSSRSGGRDGYERERERDRDLDRDRERDRDRDYGRDRERSSRVRSGGSRSRSRSPDPGEKRRKRTSGFDMPPPTSALAPPIALPGLGMLAASPTPGAPPMMLPTPPAATPAVMPNFGQMAGLGMPQAGLPNMFPGLFPMMNTQATRHARRVYVGGLPPMANEQVGQAEQSVATFFSQAMSAIGGNSAGPGDAVVNVYINQEKRFAFVECRTVEEASNAMALDGIVYEGVAVRVRRPSDYNPTIAATLGPAQPSPHLNLAAVGLVPGMSTSSSGGADGPDRIFVGGLPYYLTEEQIKELLSSFGPLRGFDLVKDRDTGNSKGYGFCVYQDTNVTDIACAALNGMKMGDKVLTVRRATASGQPKPDQANVLAHAQQQIAMQKFALAAGGAGMNLSSMGITLPSGLPMPGMGAAPGSMGMAGLPPGLPPGLPGMAGLGAGFMPGAMNMEVPTRVVCLAQVVDPKEIVNDEEYEEILEDMREECGKYGALNNLVIPRPGPNGEMLAGVGKVFVEYADLEGSKKAKAALNGRKFGGNTVTALYYPEERFARADYVGQ